MPLKQCENVRLSEAQRLERLSKLCDELQSAVDRAHDQRRLLEEVKQVAQELLSDAESKQSRNKKSPEKSD
jgi:predicted metal-dependent enzyme (double-stranded beta helix superfamily)